MRGEEDIMKHGLPAVALLIACAASEARAMEYKGLCEASAGAFLDAAHFAVASDETNTLRIYERGGFAVCYGARSFACCCRIPGAASVDQGIGMSGANHSEPARANR
jgi:hypothetical protein